MLRYELQQIDCVVYQFSATISLPCLYTDKGYGISVLVCSGCWIGGV